MNISQKVKVTAALFDLTAGTNGPEASLIKPGFEIAVVLLDVGAN